jgi:hypothetical protein
MNRLIIAIAALFASTPLVVSAKAETAECRICEEYEAAQPRRPIPWDGAKVCFHFLQLRRDGASILVFNEDQEQINKNNPRHTKVAEPEDKFCVGRHYVEQAILHNGTVELCNGTNSFRMGAEALAWLLRIAIPDPMVGNAITTPPEEPIRLIPSWYGRLANSPRFR